MKHPGQIVLTISQVIYTIQVNKTFDSSSTNTDQALVQIRDQMMTTIKNVCALVFAQIEHTKLLTVEALLTLQVHWRDIFEMLIKHHVSLLLMTRFMLNVIRIRFEIRMILNGKNICDMNGVIQKRIFTFYKAMLHFPMDMNISDARVDWLLHR